MRAHAGWLWLLILAGAGYAAWANRGPLREAVGLVGAAHPPFLAAAVLAVAAVYLCRAFVFAIPLSLFHQSVGPAFLWATAVAATTVHQLVPSGGASGYAFLTWALHRRGVRGGHASLVAVLDTLSNAAAIGSLVVVGLVYLAASGGLRAGSVIAGFLALGALIVVGAGYLFVLQRDPVRLTRLALGVKNAVARRLGRDWGDAPVLAFLDAYYAGKKTIQANRASFARMVAYQYVALACDVAALYATLRALDATMPVSTVFLAFVVSTAGLSVVSAPGGGGSFEVIMSAFLAAHGLAKPQAIGAALLYRLIAFWLPVLASLALVRWFRRPRPG